MDTEPRRFSHEDDHGHEGVDPAELAATATELITDQTRAHPLRTLGVAFGVGWVLGGGVPRFAVRLAGIAVVRSLTDALLSGDTAGRIAGGIWRGTRSRRTNGRPSQH